MSGWRLKSGGRVDRSTQIGFTWDGRSLMGYHGDTLASALLANGVEVVGRSFKYHRPRGVISAGVEESGALVTLGRGPSRIPNAKATTVELKPGLEAHGQNAWPNVRFDLGAVNDLMSRFLAAGFYYKTFIGPGGGTRAWMFYEKFIRRAAGMGAADPGHDPARYEHVHGHCDVLVVGSGPAGLAAARAAADAGLDVLLAEQDFELGGDLLTGDAEGWRDKTLADLAAAGVRLMTRTTAFGLYDHCEVGLVERVTDHLANPSPDLPRERLHVLRTRRIVLASGAIERPFVFGHNDRPGVMSANAARIYATRFGVAPGARVAVATTNDSGYDAAIALAAAGVATTLLDSRELPPEELVAALAAAGGEVRKAVVPVAVQGRVTRGLQYGRHLGRGRAAPEDVLDCDCVAVSGGWSPALHLSSHDKTRAVWSHANACFLPGESAHVIPAGSAAGIWDRAACIASGEAAGLRAARDLGAKAKAVAMPSPGGWAGPIDPVWEVRVQNRDLKGFVDPQNDVTAEDVRLAHREGFVSVEHLKRYTTLGMSTDQGKVGNVVGLALMADASGRTIPETGTTMFRPPYTPVSIGVFAGAERVAHWLPTRRTPVHDRSVAAGAVFVDAGLWKRGWYFPREGEDLLAASKREAAMVRASVGMCDVSTLGKIMVQGPDAGEFLNRLYVNNFKNLPVGKARYGIMLREDGIVFDDGTAWRLSETDWLVTTTTAHAGAVMEHVDRWHQTRWPNLRVALTSVSDAWAALCVAGPRARHVLRRVASGVDVENEALPFMAVRKGKVGDIPVWVARISFSGELGYEIYAPADFGEALWDALFPAVEAEGGGLYGLEALDILRVEKGHVTGREIDGRVTLGDLGFGGMASKTKAFVGSALMGRAELVREDRPQLVGLEPLVEGESFQPGAILCLEGHAEGFGIGHVASIADSPHLGARVGLGFVAGGLKALEGKEIIAKDPTAGRETRLRVVSPHFVDPKGERMHG
jgi:sarcosine oxidase subunit alpha